MAGSATTETKSNVTRVTLATLNWAVALSNGPHEYRVTACDYGSTVCGAASTWVEFTVDTVHPPTPTYGTSSFDLTGNTRVGHENQPGTVQLKPNGASDLYEYVYSLTPGPITNPPACNTTVGDVTSVCGTHLATDGSATITIDPGAQTNSLTVESIDKAGNMSATATWPFTVAITLADSPDHAWIEQNADDAASTVADWSGATTAMPLTLSANASWLGVGSGPHADALSFTGALVGGAAGATTTGTPLTIDANHSFTVAAWVNPSIVNDGSYHTAVAMNGAVYSQFYLQETGGTWRFCMPRAQSAGAGNECVTQPATDPGAPAAGTWTYLVGEWDAAKHTMLLYVNGKDHAYSAPHTSVPAASSGALTVGRALQSGTADLNLWNGAIADPIVYNEVLDTTQIDAMSTTLPASLAGGA